MGGVDAAMLELLKRVERWRRPRAHSPKARRRYGLRIEGFPGRVLKTPGVCPKVGQVWQRGYAFCTRFPALSP